VNHSAANQSRRSRSGAQGERAVEHALTASERAGLGYLRKRPTQTAKRRDGGLAYTKVAGTDYAGVLRGGRAAYLEVKRVGSGDSLPYSKLRSAQTEELARVHALGALAAVVVVWGPLGTRISVIPWAELAPLLALGGRGSVDLARACVPANTPLLAWVTERDSAQKSWELDTTRESEQSAKASAGARVRRGTKR
jgi:hypothetical protein